MTAGSVYLDIPKAAEISLFLFAANIGIRPGMMNSLFCKTVYIFSAPSESFGMLQYSFSFFGTDIAAFNSRHRAVTFLLLLLRLQ